MSGNKKLYPHDDKLNVERKEKRLSLPPYFDLFLAMLPVFAGLFAGWGMLNLHLEVTWGVVVKAGLVGVVVAIVSYCINRFAIDWGTELAAGGYVLAGFFSLLSMMGVGACLWFFSFGGIVLPDVRVLRFEDHGMALGHHLSARREQASQAMRLVPVMVAARDDLSYHAACERAAGCVSGRGGGAGTLSRVLDERSNRAGAISEQLSAGIQSYDSILVSANELLVQYQTVLNDNEASLKVRRQELIRIDGEFTQVISGLENAVPVALIQAYAQELLEGVALPSRPGASIAVNALMRKHGNALNSVIGSFEQQVVGRPVFPGKAGLSDTLQYVSNFAPLAGVIWVAEGIFPLALWVYTWLFLVRQRDRRTGEKSVAHPAPKVSPAFSTPVASLAVELTEQQNEYWSSVDPSGRQGPGDMRLDEADGHEASGRSTTRKRRRRRKKQHSADTSQSQETGAFNGTATNRGTEYGQ